MDTSMGGKKVQPFGTVTSEAAFLGFRQVVYGQVTAQAAVFTILDNNHQWIAKGNDTDQ